MPKFRKTIDQLETRFDKWLYVIQNLNRLDSVPDKLRERIFEKLFESAEIAKLDSIQRNAYEDSLKYYRDLKNSLETALDEGEKIGEIKGEKRGIEKGIKLGRAEGIDLAMEIVRLAKSGLSKEEIADQTETPIGKVEGILEMLG